MVQTVTTKWLLWAANIREKSKKFSVFLKINCIVTSIITFDYRVFDPKIPTSKIIGQLALPVSLYFFLITPLYILNQMQKRSYHNTIAY
jgi:hypothetical protein